MTEQDLKKDDVQYNLDIPDDLSPADVREQSGTPLALPKEPFVLEKIMASKKFVEFLDCFPPVFHSDIVGLTLQYLQFHPDGFDFCDFLAKIKIGKPLDYDITGAAFVIWLRDSIAKKLNLHDPEELASRMAIRDYILDKVGVNGCVYHGFNGAFTESIRTHGLSPGIRDWDYSETEEIRKILATTGQNNRVMGFVDKDQHKIYYDHSATFTFYHAVHSPEWFCILIDEVGDELLTYDSARNNLIEKTNYGRGLSIANRIKVLAFFEKYWKKFRGVSSAPKVALLPRSKVDPNFRFGIKRFMEHAKGVSSEEIVLFAVQTFLKNVDHSFEEMLPLNQFLIIDLPLFTHKQAMTVPNDSIAKPIIGQQ